jgi:hypothetical protein
METNKKETEEEENNRKAARDKFPFLPLFHARVIAVASCI